jgi:hypothetical protein
VVQWFDVKDALKNLAYANEVNVLERALDLIAERDSANSEEKR